ncbi:MAG TPA: hypothetical protein VGH79_04755 [Gaiellaceae bacterium]|jgi:hypothetical protein
MFKRRLRLPSPALVISMLALSLVLGGTAIAATKGGNPDAAADKALIKKMAPTLSVKNAKELAGKPASSYEAKSSIMWAVVSNSGSPAVVRSTPGVTVSSGGTGNVNVTFPRDVSGCAWTATQGNPGNTFVDHNFATVRGSGNSTQVEVITWNESGSQVNAGFHVLVTC